MFRIDHIENRIFKALKEYLTLKSFDFEDAISCSNVQDVYTDEISFRVVRVGVDFGIICYFTRSYGIIETELNNWIKKFGLREMDYTIWLTRTRIDPSLEDTKGYSILEGGGIYLKSSNIDNEIEKFKNTFIDEYENLITPFLKQTEDVHWMDKILNAEPFDIKNVKQYFPTHLIDSKRLIVAKLANNKHYEDIYNKIIKLCNEFIAETNDGDTKKELEVIRITYDRLKDVKPLENPNLTEC